MKHQTGLWLRSSCQDFFLMHHLLKRCCNSLECHVLTSSIAQSSAFTRNKSRLLCCCDVNICCLVASPRLLACARACVRTCLPPCVAPLPVSRRGILLFACRMCRLAAANKCHRSVEGVAESWYLSSASCPVAPQLL